MKIYPVEGRLARDPRTMEPVPATGKTVSDYDAYWLRRLKAGDVTKTPPAAATPAQPAVTAQPATATPAQASATPQQQTATPAQDAKA
ncbi:MAG: DUF2635 domain-containing protein [Acetobacter peroxydans]|jgi:hypothetical protein|nr:DUF2635 domain-containing protein [Acetobacter peroxydans]